MRKISEKQYCGFCRKVRKMVKEIVMPKIGYTMEEGMIVKWIKKVGDAVKEGEPVLEITSDKANMELEAPCDGILLKIMAEEEEYVPVLQPVALIGDMDEKIDESGDAVKAPHVETEAKEVRSVPSMASSKDKIYGGHRLSPRARKFAYENKISENEITMEKGSGYKGMITERDLKKLVDSWAKPTMKQAVPLADAQYVVPSNLKQVTAERLTQSIQEIPQFFVGMDVDAQNLLNLKSKIEEVYNKKCSITTMLVKCVSHVLSDHKEKMNVSWINGKIAVHPTIRIGVAVATDKGLVVAVIDEPDKKGLLQIDSELKTLAGKAKDGRLAVEETARSTFTVSNLGMYGVDEFNAIINPPESGILAVGRTVKKAVVLDDDTVDVRPVMRLNLTVDHRVLDGADAAQLLGSIKKYIECPELML
jgi:pyruvate dehydrogenase E2 component (dihydrolipoamide acetyltransferase)